MNYVVLRRKLWRIAPKSYRFYVNIPMNVCAMVNVTTMQHRRFYVNIPMNVCAMVNVTMMQLHWFYVNIPMHVCVMVNVTMMQHHRFYVNLPMNICAMVNVTMMQLGTSCSFDSPGLARNEPTLGKRLQRDSTPSVLSFFCEGTLTMKPFMADCAEKAQHLRRCSTHNLR